MIALQTTYDYWLLLRNFAPVLVLNFYDDCLTDHLRLLAFAAKLWTCSGVKLLRWLPDWLPTTTGFCRETLQRFWCETFTVIAWPTNYDYWLLLRNFVPFLVWNFYGYSQTDLPRLLAFTATLCTSSSVKLLRWLPDWLPTITGFGFETLHQFLCETFTVLPDWLPTISGFCFETLHLFCCETFTVIASRTTYD